MSGPVSGATSAPGQEAPVLEIRTLSKTFGVTTVLDDVTLDIRAGEVHALVGENGSGKSTLIKILAGFHAPDAGGSVLVRGESLAFDDPQAADRLGLRFVHQDLGLVADLDAVDNLALGVGYRRGLGGRIRWGAERRAAETVLGDLGYDIDVRVPVGTLSISERTAVAIARALSERRSQLHVLVLDEPTANLPEPEVERLFALLRRVRDNGVAIVFVSHHFNEVFGLADKTTVLRDGRAIATTAVADITEEALIELMIGRRLEVTEVARVSREERAEHTVLSVRSLSGNVLRDVDLRVAAGEIVGIAGITGSGREELGRLIGGDRDRSGTVEVGDHVVPPRRPDLARRHGMSYVPAERAANAVLHEHSVRENLTVSGLSPFVSGGRISRARERVEVDRLMEEFDIRPRRPALDIASLSGGNQQKVVLARAIRLRPDVLVLDDPTQGVDVGAQADLHQMIRREADRGAAVVMCSSVSEELAQVADRVLVLAGGRVVRELVPPLDPDEITAACLSTSTPPVPEGAPS